MTMENLLTELTEIYANISFGKELLAIIKMEWIFKGKFLNNFTVSDWWLVHSHHCNKYTYVENL